jgi:hypothetical protein
MRLSHNQQEGFIYLWWHLSYITAEGILVFKLGKTISLPDRKLTYITGELYPGKYVIAFKVSNIHSVEYALKEEFKSLNVRIAGDGSEFFCVSIKEKISKLLRKNNIKYTVLDPTEIDEIKRRTRILSTKKGTPKNCWALKCQYKKLKQ